MTLQNRIWAARARQNMPKEEISEVHLLGLNVLVGEKAGKVTKQVEGDETGERYEVELEDGTVVEVGQHEVQIADHDVTEGEPSDDIQEGTGDGSGSAESKEEEDEDQLDEYAMEDEEETADYDTFFKAALKKFGVEDPGDFKSEEEKKEFFNYIDKNFKGKKEKKESVFSDEELAHFESVLKKNETESDLDEAQSVPLVRTGQGSYTKDTHPKRKDGKVARYYQADSKAEYDKMVSQGTRMGADITGHYKKNAVDAVFGDDIQRKKFEKMFKIK